MKSLNLDMDPLSSDSRTASMATVKADKEEVKLRFFERLQKRSPGFWVGCKKSRVQNSSREIGLNIN